MSEDYIAIVFANCDSLVLINGENVRFYLPKFIPFILSRNFFEEERQGLTKPNLVYLKKFIETPELQLKSKTVTSGGKEIFPQGVNTVYLKKEEMFTSEV